MERVTVAVDIIAAAAAAAVRVVAGCGHRVVATAGLEAPVRNWK